MSFYRNFAFFLKGTWEFTRSGFEKASKLFDPTELDAVDLSGRVAVVTGANSGIGYCCVLELARKGAEVHMICRNRQRADEAKQKIVESTKNNKIYTHIVDLVEPKQVSLFCSEFLKTGSLLHLLINNAGCMVNSRATNSEGMEVNFATNTLSTYLITNLLLPALKKSTDSRVITVSSGGMLTQKLNALDPELKRDPIANENFDGTMVYAQNKRQQVVMSEMWAEANPEVFIASMHPGWADTPAVATSMPSFHSRMDGKLRTPEQGADTIIWLAMTPHVRALKSGVFYFDRSPASTHLTLARTHSSRAEKQLFMDTMLAIAQPYLSS